MKLEVIVIGMIQAFLCTAYGQSCTDGDIRLVVGDQVESSGEGRLEYCRGGEWGTVCNEGWDLTDARVACSELLRQVDPNSVRTNLFYGGGDSTQAIHIVNVTCSGNETRLVDCVAEDVLESTCGHDRDVGLICQVVPTECTDGSVRLVGGPTADEGRVEYCAGGRWGTVCNNKWGVTDVAVVCTELGFQAFDDELRSVDTTVPSDAAAADRPIVLSGLDCNGTESGLTECSRASAISQCTHSEDAGARCKCRNNEVRLVEGNAENTGRLEYCQGGEWRIICLGGIDPLAAAVACRQLEFESADGFMPFVIPINQFSRAPINERGGTINLRYEYGFQCSGDEASLSECPIEAFTDVSSACRTNAIGISCPTAETAVCTSGDIRLQDGVISSEFGRVEVCFNGQWGLVCDDSWDDTDAEVACRQLGIEGGSRALQGDRMLFGQGDSSTQIVVLDDLECSGNELSLFNCPHPGTTVHDCSISFSDANLICGISAGRCPEEGIESTVIPEPDQVFMFPSIGTCEPYQDESSFCSNFIDSESYVFNHGVAQAELAQKLQLVSVAIAGRDENCHSLVSKVICNHFFPVCGGQDGVHRPISVCSEECLFVAENCTETWTASQGILMTDSLGAINCSNTDSHLNGSSGCCSGLNITIPTTVTLTPPTSPSPSPETMPRDSILDLIAPLAGGIIGAIVVIAIILMVIVACLCMSSFRRRKIVREIQMEVLTRPTRVVPVSPDSSRGQEDSSPTKTLSASPSPSPIMYAGKMRNGSKKVVPNPYSRVFPPEKELDYSAPLLNPDNSKSNNRISSAMIRELSSDMVIPYCRLNLLDCIGQGEFGVVYKAEYTLFTDEICTVAVKTLKGFFDKEKVDSIMDESLKMKHFDHPNVLGLTGVCLDAGPAPYVIMPYMANGSLLHYLKKERSNIVLSAEVDDDVKVDIRKRLTIMCLQIANGMDYLADEKFIHRDLAARNCMIDLHFVIKISDFGLSEDVYSKNYFRQSDSDNCVKLPVKWMAPESLNDGIFSEKTDVWSFGVTCWEVFSGGKTPYPGVDPIMLSQILDKNKRLLKPLNSSCSNEMYDLMKECWATNPAKRPTFTDIAKTLSTYTESLAGYLDMTFNPFEQKSGNNHQGHQPAPAEQEEEGFDVLTRPDKLAQLYENIPKSKSPRSSPRGSLRTSPIQSPTNSIKGFPAVVPTNIKICIDSCS